MTCVFGEQECASGVIARSLNKGRIPLGRFGPFLSFQHLVNLLNLIGR